MSFGSYLYRWFGCVPSALLAEAVWGHYVGPRGPVVVGVAVAWGAGLIGAALGAMIEPRR